MERAWQIIIIIVVILFVIYLVYRSNRGYREHMTETSQKIISVVDLGGQDGYHVERLFNYLIGNNLIQNSHLFRFDRIKPCHEDMIRLSKEGVKYAIGMFETNELEAIRPFLNENPDFTIISTASTGVISHQNCIVRTSSSDLDNANLIQLMYRAKFGANSAIIFYDTTSKWARTMMGILSPMSHRVVGYTHWWEISRNWHSAVMNENDTDKVVIILNKPQDTKLILQRMPALEMPVIFGDTSGFFDITDIPNSNIHLNKYFCLTPGLWNQNDYRLSKRIFGEFVSPNVINIASAISIVSDVLSRGVPSQCLVKSIINLYGPQGWNTFNTENDYAISSRLLSEYKDASWEPAVSAVMYGQLFFIGKSAGWYI